MQKIWWIEGSMLLRCGCAIALLFSSAGCGQRGSVSTQAVPPTPPRPCCSYAGNPANPLPSPIPDLIPSTVPADRVAAITTGRAEPFAAVANRPIVTLGISSAPDPTATPRTAPSPTAISPTVISPTVVPARSPAARPAPMPTLAPTALPQSVAPPGPTIARSIAISGVVQMGDGSVSASRNRTRAIVQVPQEGSRYVGVGDRIASGRVLVKRIEVGTNTDPVVILEEDGVEVTRTVGSS